MIFISMVSIWIIPLIIFIILLIATWKKVPTYELFVEGGKEGIDISLSILPFLLGMLVSIAILQSSGALSAFVELFTPILSLVGIPADIVPLAIVKPISGTASLGMMTELTRTYGPDSFLGKLAATMQGSTDTTLYVLTVYFGAIGINKIRYALKVGLLADVFSVIGAIIIVKIFFG